MKSLVRVAAVGVTGLVAFKVVTALVFPLFGMLVFVVLLTVKLALVAAVAYFLYSLLFKRRDDVEVHDVNEKAARNVQEEIEVEIEVDDPQ